MDWFEDNGWDVNAKCDSLNRELFSSMLPEAVSKSKQKGVKVKKRKRNSDSELKITNKISKSKTSFTSLSTPATSENTEKIILSKKQKRRLKEKNRIKRKKKERLAYQSALSLKDKATSNSSKKHKERKKEIQSNDLESSSISATNTKTKLHAGENIQTEKRKKHKKSSSKKNKYKHLAYTTNLEIHDSSVDADMDSRELTKIDSFQAPLRKRKKIVNSNSGNAESKLCISEDVQNIPGKKKKSKSQIKIEQDQKSKKKEIEFKTKRLKDPSDTWSSSSSSEVNRHIKSPSSSLKINRHIKSSESKLQSKQEIHVLSNSTPEKAEEIHQLFNSNRKLKKMSVRDRMKEKLDAARFRFLNEKLYTTNGKEAFHLFHGDNDAFEVYHRGFQTQVSKWPVNPLNVIIKSIKNRHKNIIVADLGCGEAKLAQSVPQKVYSFDLVALNQYVTVCDIAKLPMKHDSVDIVVFCLSLMGTNLTDYITEANRILRNGGIMKIAEVTSRFKRLDRFVTKVEKMGFVLLSKDTSNTMFVMMDFEKKSVTKKSVSSISLDPCLYKRR